MSTNKGTSVTKTGGRQATVELDTSALQHNLSVAKKSAPHSRVMSVVKSNAYGHGVELVVKALSQSDGFAVACFSEALRLRQLGVIKPILVMQGATSPEQYRAAVVLKMTLVVHDMAQLELYRQQPDHPDIWVKIDTGMHRFGFTVDQVSEVMNVIGGHCSGLMTHFSDADDPAKPNTGDQLKQFNTITESYALQRSAANSAALLTRSDAHYDWVRPGIMLYGATPLLSGCGGEIGLQPVMNFTAPVVSLKQLSKGDRVGYGGDYVCKQDTIVAVIGAGYGDGYPRLTPTGTMVLINGMSCPVLGRVSMDSFSVDVTQLERCELGDRAILWGPQLPVEHLAKSVDTLSYSLLCGVR